jgi:ADP-heptose:LPS heptosyltransferase
MSPASALRAGDRVLVTRLNYLGDVVLSLPVVDALCAAGAEVDYLTREPAASLLRGDARIARVIGWRDEGAAALRTLRELRSRRYRAVIDLYTNPRSAWLSYFSGAALRVGGNRRGRRLLYTHRVDPPRALAVNEVFLRYLEPLGVGRAGATPVLRLSDAEREAAESLLMAAGARAGTAPRIGVHPGGKWAVKRWPAAHFAELLRSLEHSGMRAVLFTGPDEVQATREVERMLGRDTVVLDALPVRTVAAVISRLDGMVACDGGIMHTAAAVGTPTVGIFGSAQPSVWFPYEALGAHRAAYIEVDCRPCHRHVCPLGHTRCLNDLRPDRVRSVLDDVLARGMRRA